MVNRFDVMNLAFKIGHHADNLVFDRDQKGTLLTLALTGAVGGGVGYALSGTRAAAAAGTGIRYFGYIRRPVLSYGVHHGYRGASTLMGLSKAYAATMLAHGIYEFDKNQALFRQKEYKRLGINMMGPPGSLWLYDQLYNGPAKQSLASSSSPSQQNGGAKGIKTSTKSKKSKKPKFLSLNIGRGGGRKSCPPGYRRVTIKGREMCQRK